MKLFHFQVFVFSFTFENQVLGFVHILRNHFVEVLDGILRLEAATVGCGRRPQHLCGHSNSYSRPEAATVPCDRRAQDSISHR